ncbi:MAG: hypothetical protein HN366_23080 [Deltaproteobacteria bacterium]|nr:hypothetical protein [Deltaproteobacteria bacterium]
MKFRDTILVVVKVDIHTTELEQNLRDEGYFSIRIEKPDSFVPLIDSRDRVRALVFVDGAQATFEECYTELKILKAMSRDMPLIFSTGANTPQKENRMRDMGLFYYHTEDMGLPPLVTAIDRAVNKSVNEDKFL